MLSYSWLRWCSVVIDILLDLHGICPPGSDPTATRGIPRNDTQAAVNMSRPYERHFEVPVSLRGRSAGLHGGLILSSQPPNVLQLPLPLCRIGYRCSQDTLARRVQCTSAYTCSEASPESLDGTNRDTQASMEGHRCRVFVFAAANLSSSDERDEAIEKGKCRRYRSHSSNQQIRTHFA